MKKHVLCIGDSNTHGYCADPNDCADHGVRFNEDERWTCLLQKALGEGVLVTEEGLSGRTTVFEDPIHENMPAFPMITALLKSHEPVDLLVIMLGTNDSKERFSANAACISMGMDRLIAKAMQVDCWPASGPNILLIAPAPIEDGFFDAVMGEGCIEKTRGLAEGYAKVAKQRGVAFLDAKGCEMSPVDHMHLSRLGHAQLAERLAQLVPTLL